MMSRQKGVTRAFPGTRTPYLGTLLVDIAQVQSTSASIDVRCEDYST